MTIQLQFLGSNTPLTKTFTLDSNGKLDKSSYPMVKNFTSFTETVSTLSEFRDAVIKHAELGRCLLKGKLDKNLIHESRAGHTAPSDKTDWIVFDIDGLPYAPDEFMKIVGYEGVEYFVQYSASAGVIRNQDNGTVNPCMNRYHIFALLDKPYSPADLKIWLKHLNLTKPELREHLGLTATNMSLTWPLDITVCQNDKLIYITPPECGKGVLDSIVKNRIFKQSSGLAAISLINDNHITLQLNQSLQLQHVKDMRSRLALPDKLPKSTTYRSIKVLANPDSATVTGIRAGREFVYLNLNGGDSWGYYHPVTNADVIYNFKDEPNYRTEVLAPDYYVLAYPRAKQAQQKSKANEAILAATQYVSEQQTIFDQQRSNNGKYHCMFRDRQTDTYFVGYHDFSDNTNYFNKVGSKDAGFDYLKQHKGSEPDPVLTWDYQYKPENQHLIDLEQNFVNKFQSTKYMSNAVKRTGLSVPVTIQRLIYSALGAEQEMYDHFINWLAVIFQHRIRTESAWVLQGTTGTGKGALFNNIIKPLIGDSNCRLVTLQSLEENFNGYAERCLVLFVDEVDTDQIKQQQQLIAKLKSWITEPKLPVRAMRTDLREVDNYLNIIMASNQPNSMRIESNDRRINVCPRQEHKLLGAKDDGQVLMRAVESELDIFADYLQSYQCDIQRARTPIENEAKQILQATTQTAIEEVAEALKSGDLQYFIDHKPDGVGTLHYTSPIFDGYGVDINDSYNKILEQAVICGSEGKRHLMKHRDIFVLFQSLVGKTPNSKAKLSSLLRHHGIDIKPQTYNGTTVRGLKILWQSSIPTQPVEKKMDVASIANTISTNPSSSDIGELIAHSREFQAAQKFKKS